MSKLKRYSIIHNLENGECLVCGSSHNTHIHEVFFGTANRRLSIEFGLCVCLCERHHIQPPTGVHFNKMLDDKLKAHAQKIAMQKYNWNTQKFIEIFGKNYIGE